MAAGPQHCYVALGGNLGDRLRSLSGALKQLRELEGVRVVRTSSLYSTAPQYVTDQPPFLNAIAAVELSEARQKDVQGLLTDLKAIEESIGRTPGVRRGPRVVDLDVVALGEEHVKIDEGKYPIEVPHANMHERDFVLVPLAELCPEWRHPLLPGRPSAVEMREQLKAGSCCHLPPGASPATWPLQMLPLAGGLHGRAAGPLLRRGERTLVMGILNATPDSFSDGGDHLRLEDAVAAAEAMAAAGADIIDVGGESTRPGAAEVPVEEEIGRVAPVIRAIRERGLDVLVSVDTRKAPVARAAVAAGADWINDVSGGEFDADMLPAAAELLAPVVLMHTKGTPETMNSQVSYKDLLAEVGDHLLQRREAAESIGVPSWNIILDPGIGFAKMMDENLLILRHCSSLVQRLQPSPVLLSSSRKKFLGTILQEPDAKKRTFGNAACAAAGVAGGADAIRVHDVKEMAQTIKVSDYIYRGPPAKSG